MQYETIYHRHRALGTHGRLHELSHVSARNARSDWHGAFHRDGRACFHKWKMVRRAHEGTMERRANFLDAHEHRARHKLHGRVFHGRHHLDDRFQTHRRVIAASSEHAHPSAPRPQRIHDAHPRWAPHRRHSGRASQGSSPRSPTSRVAAACASRSSSTSHARASSRRGSLRSATGS